MNARSGGVSDSRGGGQKREQQCATDPGMVDEEYRGLSRTTAVLPSGRPCRSKISSSMTCAPLTTLAQLGYAWTALLRGMRSQDGGAKAVITT